MIFFDVETTGLIRSEALPPSQQPQIVEIGALLCDGTGDEVGCFHSFVNPGVPMPPEVTKINGITDAMLAGAPTFIEVYGALADFMGKSQWWLAHNSRFDEMMLAFELRRVDKERRFPWPRRIEDTRGRLPGKLQLWAEKLHGPGYQQAHRAVEDCRLLRDCYFKFGQGGTPF